MPEARVIDTIEVIGRDAWDACFPGEVEGYDYLQAVEKAGIEGFRWRYALVEEDGRLLAAAPGFLTDYRLDTTLSGAGKRVADAVRRVFPRALLLRLACLGSPCTETAQLGFAPGVTPFQRSPLAHELINAFEIHAAAESCYLLGLKDVSETDRAIWDHAACPLGYRPVAGLPTAWLNIDFDSVGAYLARLSPSARKDMRRKLRSRDQVEVEIRRDLDDVIDQVMVLYAATHARAEMQLETLTADYFRKVLRAMGERSLCVLYRCGGRLLGFNLLLQGDGLLLDKFFCMSDEARVYNLYFLSWFENIGYCLSHGIRRYQSGQAAYEAKLRLGSRLSRTQMYFRHRNPVLNSALRLASPMFAADPVPESSAA